MIKLNREELYSLEQYAEQRADFRDRVMEHKKTAASTSAPTFRFISKTA